MFDLGRIENESVMLLLKGGVGYGASQDDKRPRG